MLNVYLDFTELLNGKTNDCFDFVALRIACKYVSNMMITLLTEHDGAYYIMRNKLLSDFLFYGQVENKRNYITNRFEITVDDGYFIYFIKDYTTKNDLARLFSDIDKSAYVFGCREMPLILEKFDHVIDLEQNIKFIMDNSEPVLLDFPYGSIKPPAEIKNIDSGIRKILNEKYDLLVLGRISKSKIRSYVRDRLSGEKDNLTLILDYSDNSNSIMKVLRELDLCNYQYLYGIDYYSLKVLKAFSRNYFYSEELVIFEAI